MGMARGDDMFSAEEINGLLRCLPSQDERDMLRRHEARYAELGMAEQFMLTMMSISQVGLRCVVLTAMMSACSGSWLCIWATASCSNTRCQMTFSPLRRAGGAAPARRAVPAPV